MRKLLTGILAVSMVLTLASCEHVEKGKTLKIAELTEAEKNAGVLTPEVLLKLRRISGVSVSPDGKHVVYSVSFQNVEENMTFSNLFIVDLDDQHINRNITESNRKQNYSPQWSPDGSKIYFISTSDSKGPQIYTINPDGTDRKRISNIKGGVGSFGISPKGDKVWYTTGVKVEENKDDLYPAMGKSTAKIYDDLPVRHWDYWLDGTYQHVFVADITNDGLKNKTDINKGEAWDTPMAPYFDGGQIAWSNGGDKIVYSSKKINGKEYVVSTNSDIYVYDLATKKTKNISEGMVGYDQFPVFSPDDTMVAWWSMERPGNEADKRRLFVADLNTGERRDLTRNFDYNAENFEWDGRDIYFISPIEATHQICRVSADGGDVEVITEGLHDITSVSVTPDDIIYEKMSISEPTEIYAMDRKTGEERQLSAINDDILQHIKMGEVQKRWVKTTDGKDMLVWVVLPPDFDASKKYPTLLFCEGGPQSVVSNGWSYRWNFQLMAANGYIVVAPNRRGLPSFGQEWLDQISGDYSGQNIKDYLSAIDDVAKEPWSDEDRLGAVGASYGGYSVYYLASHHDKRFKAFISHCGMYDFDSFYGSTEELWFPNNDLGGPFWKNDKTVKRSYEHSPHRFVTEWDTPILIITGMNDYRIPYTQSLEAYTAARLMGLDSRLVVFEDEAHQVFKPQNAMVWHGEFFRWLDKYLK